ncbi:nucleotide sugar dehydrogenase family protein [Escherichia coli 2-011-08_S4_C3]|uniref:nucleotide sugar dehydrogenase n=1 Tax=Escherichia coli TaxID=562 RepID=UPI0004D6210C|nr:nucleotide sugar dehydrogenase [Escherichia coli]KDS96049.1 nucleotide sugar dehydrogenase family protein [Escherichia coli 2-011-08_S4_C1]KDT11167.1 nucleotide sugar dehydrogenase family protein [Escherichia coli 2-011-08_S4_C3]MDQ9248559.1 nucleotide sugar dehydrogenase [Escherichia coli]HAV9442123.1 nucleotide sugar dehydrogenase [Escherichia coli]HCP6383613.1 nucleotide sugar dehydrogenase [Escherichia coli]
MFDINQLKICVIGLGYVGLPLAIEFGKFIPTSGYDIDNDRICELRDNIDHTLEVESHEFKESKFITFTNSVDELSNCNFYIVTVPTPVNDNNIPDISIIHAASATVGQVLKKGDIVVFESTVYPGATEEVCIPELERVSGLTFNTDFYVGYSPERINPGDKQNRLPYIKKITSGSTPESSEFIDTVYNIIIKAGTHKAESIKVAEAAKVIENTQRDVNIALVNELSMIFDRLGINTHDVIEAAGTKWNFQKLYPGLVGGHCIGVDPYYLAHKAKSIGHYPDMILTARRLNQNMSVHVVNKLTREMSRKKIHIVDSNVLILGFTFKENCPDIRNTQVVNLYKELLNHNAIVDIYDPWASKDEVKKEYGIQLITSLNNKSYDAVIIAVSHNEFKKMSSSDISKITAENSIIFDLKRTLEKELVDCTL